MSMRWPALICVILLVGGCHTPPMQEIDQTVSNLASHPFDVAPTRVGSPSKPVLRGRCGARAPGLRARMGRKHCRRRWTPNRRPRLVRRPSAAATGRRLSNSRPLDDNVVRTSFTQPDRTAPDQAKQHDPEV